MSRKHMGVGLIDVVKWPIKCSVIQVVCFSRKHMEVRLNRCDQKNAVFVMSVGLTKRFEGNDASF